MHWHGSEHIIKNQEVVTLGLLLLVHVATTSCVKVDADHVAEPRPAHAGEQPRQQPRASKVEIRVQASQPSLDIVNRVKVVSAVHKAVQQKMTAMGR